MRGKVLPLNRGGRLLFVLVLLLAVVLSTTMTAAGRTVVIDQVAGLVRTSDGNTLLAVYDDDIKLYIVDPAGAILHSTSIDRNQNGLVASIEDIAIDENGTVFLIKNLLDPYSGKLSRQELDIYDMDRVFRKRASSVVLDSSGSITYKWIEVSSSVSVMGVDENQSLLVRKAYDTASLYYSALPEEKSSRSYQLKQSVKVEPTEKEPEGHPSAPEGIYSVLTIGSDVVYMSMSGKVFYASGEETVPVELFPARVLTEALYPMFIAPLSAEEIYIGAYERGDIMKLSLKDGSTYTVKNGSEPFSGISGYAPVDVCSMSMDDPSNFSALVRNRTSNGFSLLSSQSGMTNVITELRFSGFSTALKWLGWFALCTAGLLIIEIALWAIIRVLRDGRLLISKLLLATIPLFAVLLALFGVFANITYKDSIEEAFQKQVADEGNMLTALFGVDLFDELEYPYDYTKSDYTYFQRQLRSRKNQASAVIHSAISYYEREKLHTGVDEAYPCFYPFGIRLDSNAEQIFLRAAYTGKPQTGTIDDVYGKRIACVTPIGGVSGGTVYLLETSVMEGSVKTYTDAYLRNYILISVLFVALFAVAMLFFFRKILFPLGALKRGLEEFAEGRRSVRLETNSTDEFFDIVRVFNKMADDINQQIYTLQHASKIYYRFIPPRMLQMLGKDNLGEVTLGTGIEKECHVLCISLETSPDRFPPGEERALTNRYFNAINHAADSREAVLVTDSVNLRKIRIICPEGGDSSADIALAIITAVDSINNSVPEQYRLSIMVVVHKAAVYYGISGDDDRLIPTLLSEELDRISEMESELRQFDRKLLVTGAAFRDLPDDGYFWRYIGDSAFIGKRPMELYDFYDCCSAEETRLLKETVTAFNKAVALYQEERWYDAKNLFALVLRQNQFDNVSRRYIFSCEQRLK